MDELFGQISAFLEHHRVSTGGYAPVEDGDMKQLYDIVKKLVEAKWDRDPDGDLPVAIDLTDKTKYETLYYSPVPHRSRAYDLEDAGHKDRGRALRNCIMDRCISNARAALTRLETEHRIEEHDRRQEEKLNARFQEGEELVCTHPCGQLEADELYVADCHSYWGEDEELVRVVPATPKTDTWDKWRSYPVWWFRKTVLPGKPPNF